MFRAAKPTILLTGKSGQVGRQLLHLLPQLGEVHAYDRRQMDLSKPDEIRSAIRSVRPTLIVNAAAYTAVDLAESQEAEARSVNAEAPAVMAKEAKNIGATLVHYSTDYIFNGMKGVPYEESDEPCPQNAYGRTKLEGEQAIQESGVAHLIFRTAWVYGFEGRNFLLTILRLATQNQKLRVVCDQIGAPTFCGEIANATTRILFQLLRESEGLARLADVSGIYHMTAAGEASWHAFAEAILEETANSRPSAPWFAAATNNLPLIADQVIPIPSASYPTPARRPAYSVLSNSRLARAFSVELPGWRTQLHSVFVS